MNRVVRGSTWTRIWAFFFPAEVSEDESRPGSRGRPLLLWVVAGLGASALGWIAGGFLGLWAPRTACAAGAVALVLGLLSRRPGAALAGAASATIVSLIAVQIGESFFSPLLAWPVAAVVIGVMGALLFRRRRARIAFVIGAPFLGAVGLLAGMMVTFCTAVGLNDSRVSAQTMLGGAAGFGVLLMAGAAISARWLDATRKTGGVS